MGMGLGLVGVSGEKVFEGVLYCCWLNFRQTRTSDSGLVGGREKERFQDHTFEPRCKVYVSVSGSYLFVCERQMSRGKN